MHIRFSEIDDAFIKEAVEKGFYLSETELVRDAVRRMREWMQNQKSNQRFKDAVEAGRRSFEEGEAIPYTTNLMDDIKKRAIKKAENGEVYNNNDSIPN